MSDIHNGYHPTTAAQMTSAATVAQITATATELLRRGYDADGQPVRSMHDALMCALASRGAQLLDYARDGASAPELWQLADVRVVVWEDRLSIDPYVWQVAS